MRANSGPVEKTLMGTATAPVRVMANHATTQSIPLGAWIATREYFVTPAPRRVRASSRDLAFISAQVIRPCESTMASQSEKASVIAARYSATLVAPATSSLSVLIASQLRLAL